MAASTCYPFRRMYFTRFGYSIFGIVGVAVAAVLFILWPWGATPMTMTEATCSAPDCAP